MERPHRPETEPTFLGKLKHLAQSALYFTSGPHPLATHGDHEFKFNHLPQPSDGGEAEYEIIEDDTVTGYDQLGYPVYEHPFDGITRDSRGL